jgi:quercetin dioxygenase-like cupin family protein
MATKISLSDAVDLDLPGRRSREIFSGAMGADSTFRLVDIAVPRAGDAPRLPHWHPDSEECIHVLAGQGTTWVEGTEFTMRPGDTIHIPATQRHVTRNTGDGPLTLLCFFPRPHFETETEARDV